MPTQRSARDTAVGNTYIEGELTLKQIGHEWGISEERVRQIVRDQGLTPSDRKKTPRRKPQDMTQPISDLHYRLGQQLVDARINELQLSPEEFSTRMGMDKVRLRAIERGITEPTLTELSRFNSQLPVEIFDYLNQKRGSAE